MGLFKSANTAITILLTSTYSFDTSNAFSSINHYKFHHDRIASSSSSSNIILQSSSEPIQSSSSSSTNKVPVPVPVPTTPQQRKKNLKTFARYLEIESWKRGPNARDLEMVLRSIGEACKQINRIVQRAQTDDLYGVAVGADGEQLDSNVQGEVQQKLDVVCNNIMLKQFCGSSKGVIAAVASEEEDLPRSCCDVMVSFRVMGCLLVMNSFTC